MKIYAFDLDGTIIKSNNLTTSVLYQRTKVADVIDELFENPNNFIVVYTARSYKIFNETRELLNRHKIKYHSLVMEKLRADVYIDNKGLDYDESFIDKLRNR